jgi:hypothetical protein
LCQKPKRFPCPHYRRWPPPLQKQTTRDLAPIWEIKATVDAFAKLNEVPVCYWPIIITEEDLGDAAGIHEDKDGQPFSLVKYDNGWSLTASHERLEMLVDPFGWQPISRWSITHERPRSRSFLGRSLRS